MASCAAPGLNRPMLSINKAAQKLGRSKSTVHEWAKRGMPLTGEDAARDWVRRNIAVRRPASPDRPERIGPVAVRIAHWVRSVGELPPFVARGLIATRDDLVAMQSDLLALELQLQAIRRELYAAGEVAFPDAEEV